MKNALKGLIAEAQQRLNHAEVLVDLIGEVNEKNAQLMREMSRLKGENERLRELIQNELRHPLTSYRDTV